MTDQKVRQYREPIFGYFFEVGIPIIKHYHADLGHDVMILSSAKVGTKFFWACYTTGTHMVKLPNMDTPSDQMGTSFLECVMRIIGKEFLHTFTLVEVTKIVNGYVHGYVTPLQPKDDGEIIRVWEQEVKDIHQKRQVISDNFLMSRNQN